MQVISKVCIKYLKYIKQKLKEGLRLKVTLITSVVLCCMVYVKANFVKQSPNRPLYICCM